ncbi:protein unc-79 homolog isoform X19 [Struthio camelus]|uniref:protein unc-79 homolog isoform X19 n=1 Tax=Struthio camelus TaxID=8801 RepID=UPI0036042C22
MSTKAEQFASKIRYLQEYHNRVLHNIYPVPSGTDIANTLKYFSQTLLSILSRTGKKENQDASNLTVPMTMCLFPVPFPLTPSLRPQVSSINPTVTRSLLYSVLRDAPSERGQQSRDAQLSDYPSLDYQGLYVTLVTLLDLVPLLQHGQHDLGQSIFYTTTCLLPFLSDDILSTLPYTMISTLATFPPFLHKDIIEYLSTSFLPMAILGSSKREGVPAHVNLSASSMLMIAMQYTSNPVYHCQLLECLMKYKQEVWKDLLYVIAYGPSQVKPPAVQMLFHYWPNLKPPGAISEYRGLQYTAWNPIHCQHIECHNAINKPAVKMCIDPSLSVALGDKPPPLYLCEECSQRIAGDHSEWLIDVLLPQAEISAICQKKNCSSHVRRAVVTCFSAGCCGRHGNRPVRYCKRCHSNHHSSEVGAAAETHLYQTSPPPINTRECGAEELVCTVEAVISLLKEAEFHAEQREYELNRRRQMGLSSSHHSLDNTDFDNKDDDKHDQRLLSQFGIWFLVSLCTPSENTPTESLARLVSMVFQWFHSTAYMMDDEVGSLVEKLKPQFVTKWLKTVCDVRFDVMVMCLLPKPMEFARVGGYWDKSCSAVTQLKEGLNRILCLIPYNVINQPVWECIMPEWLEAIRTEVPDNHLKEFREVLSKMFDIELCPLPFSMEEMFGFISCRFTGYPSSVQEQALLWLHVLSELDIVVPLQLLISMFSDGVNSVKELANQRKSRVSELAGNLAARRVSVASDPGRRVQHNTLSPFPSPFQSPFRSPIRSPFQSPFKNFGHQSGKTIDFDCEDDEMNLNCFILMFDLILKQMELQDDGVTLGLENSISKDIISIINNVLQAPWGGSHTCQKDEKAVECGLCQSSILCYQLGFELLEQLAPKEEIRLVVMDYNINLGKHLLPLVVQVLKYCTCPQLRHYFQQPPRCSLWSLKPHIRQMWLKALLVILYKYPYRDCEISKIVLHLIHITVNTLNAQYHSCKPHATAGPLYSDNSNISRYSEKEKAEEDSVFDESDIHDTPTGPCNKESQTFFARLKRIGGSKMVKYQPVEMNAQRSEIELAEYRETGALQDSILRCVREESIQKKKLRSLKQKSLDIGNADSLLFTLDEHRRKSCIDRCDLEKPPVPAAYTMHRQNDYGRPRQNSSTKTENIETQENPPPTENFQETRRPVIPEVRLNCMETYEVKVDSPVKPSVPKEDLDLIDLSSDSTSGPEKHSVLSTSDSDSLVFEPLPPLRIVESDEEEETTNQLNDEVAGKTAVSSPSTPMNASALSLSTTPLVQFSIEDCSKDFSSKDASNSAASAGGEEIPFTTPKDRKDSSDLAKPEELQDMSCGNSLTLKQKRDLLQKSFALPEMSLDDNSEFSVEEIRPSGAIPSPNVKTVLIKVPEDSENQTESDKLDTNTESDAEQNTDQKQDEEAEESEFKIQIVPRQRKQRKIAVSAIQREYLDISFNILDKLGEQKEADPAVKGLSTLEMPRESSSAPTLEAGVPETSSHSSISTQFRQMKRGSLGALTMNQLMKRQLEHQSSAPHNISTWDTEQIQHGKRLCNVPVCLNPDLEGPPLRIRGATKSSLLSAPSIVSMFVPAPEEFADDQPTVMTDKCHDCGAILEEYDEETLGLAIVVLSTFIHLSPDLAAPLLLDIMQSVGRLASSTSFSNQAESMMIPGNAAGVAKQFLRCVFHQLAPNGIFPQLFQSNIKDGSFLRTLATSLMDFSELSSIAALSQLLEGLNNKKNLPAGGAMLRCLENVATFMEALPMDSPSNLWTTISNQFQTFLTKLPCVLPLKCSLDSSLRIMICLLKIPTTSATRSLLEPFSKLLSFVIQNAIFTLAYLVELCGLCYRAFTKERDKFYLTRSVILELLQALKLKSPLPDMNLLLLVQFVCADAGTKLAESTILHKQMIASMPGCGTAAMECMRQYVGEVLDFIADMHTLTKLKSHMKTCSQPLHEDTFGGHLKVGLAQIAAMEITRGNHRDNKAVIRYLPWLYHPPSAMQQGPKEFIECVSHIRLLSWLLLGSLTHNVVCPNSPSSCMPIPLDAGSQIADHLIVILIGFPEQSKTSVLHMCSLFHAFIFAQLWTVYCEQTAVAPTVQNQNEFSFTAILTALEFWSRVTPSILQLMAHNKVMVEMVCLHVISLMEALQECNSTIFVKLIPMWLPMIQSNLKHLSAGLQLRLQAIQSNVNHHSLRMLQGSGQMSNSSSVLRKWLQCTQFKMAQVEIQSSEAASQFYPL